MEIFHKGCSFSPKRFKKAVEDAMAEFEAEAETLDMGDQPSGTFSDHGPIANIFAMLAKLGVLEAGKCDGSGTGNLQSVAMQGASDVMQSPSANAPRQTGAGAPRCPAEPLDGVRGGGRRGGVWMGLRTEGPKQ